MSKQRWTEQEGRDVVGRWQRSGLSMTAFARDQGLGLHRLVYWRERLGGEPAAASRAELRGPKLVPGVVVDVSGGARVCVTLPRGVMVEARSAQDITPGWVAEVVRALEGEP